MVLRHLLAAALFCLANFPATASEGVFTFQPPDRTRFVRTLTRTARLEREGVVRTEVTIYKARFTFHETPSGYSVEITPLSFRYVVNDDDVDSPVWDLIRDRKFLLKLNSVGNLNEMSGFDEVDAALSRQRVAFAARSPSIHLDHLPLGGGRRRNRNEGLMLWHEQRSAPGTKLELDRRERGFTGERVRSHTSMQVVRAEKCGTRRCVVTRYTMTPDLAESARRANENRNVDLIDARASEELEQTIEPSTMLPHYEKLTWKARFDSADADDTGRWRASLVAVSEFTYEQPSGK